MGLRVSLAFFFSCACAGRGEKKTQKTSGRCWTEGREIAEGRPHFSFFLGLNLEQVLDRGYRNCGGSTALFFFFGEGLNLEQVLAELTEIVERDRDC